jgi:hypothetical protein
VDERKSYACFAGEQTPALARFGQPVTPNAREDGKLGRKHFPHRSLYPHEKSFPRHAMRHVTGETREENSIIAHMEEKNASFHEKGSFPSRFSCA